MGSSAVGVAVDPEIWRAIAGYTIKVPSLGSLVYYFPEGHAEHLNNNNNVPNHLPLPPFSQPVPSFLLCRVLGVDFLAEPLCDQVYAKFLLLPSLAPHVVGGGGGDFHVRNDGIVLDSHSGENETGDDVVSFAKILTPSDANNGGGFSVPRFCADSIFPLLNFNADPPVQNLVINDLHGNSFQFRHIYRGTPRRHLLTTGWSKFVNAKKLVAGDSVVFMRKRSTDELFIGVRRALRTSRGCSWLGQRKLGSESGEGSGFWSTKGRNVVDTLELASRGMAFEVLYYPRPGWADFVVRAELVAESMNVPWSGGMRVKLAMETEDSSRLAWYHGTVSSASVPENGPWFRSPWRMLQITWDEPEILQNSKRINPWQVEHIGSMVSLSSAFPPMKKVKVSQNPQFLAYAEDDLQWDPMVGLSSVLAQKYTPVGMQGARQNQFSLSSLFNCNSDITRQASIDDCGNADVNSNFETVSMDLNVGGTQSLEIVNSNLATVSADVNAGSPSLENISPNIEKNIQCFGTEVDGKQCPKGLAKAGSKSFLLFGKIIHLEEPRTGGFDYVACKDKEA